MADYLVLEEDGVSRISLEEDALSFILLEESGGVVAATVAIFVPVLRPRRGR